MEEMKRSEQHDSSKDTEPQATTTMNSGKAVRVPGNNQHDMDRNNQDVNATNVITEGYDIYSYSNIPSKQYPSERMDTEVGSSDDPFEDVMKEYSIRQPESAPSNNDIACNYDSVKCHSTTLPKGNAMFAHSVVDCDKSDATSSDGLRVPTDGRLKVAPNEIAYAKQNEPTSSNIRSRDTMLEAKERERELRRTGVPKFASGKRVATSSNSSARVDEMKVAPDEIAYTKQNETTSSFQSRDTMLEAKERERELRRTGVPKFASVAASGKRATTSSNSSGASVDEMMEVKRRERELQRGAAVGTKSRQQSNQPTGDADNSRSSNHSVTTQDSMYDVKRREKDRVPHLMVARRRNFGQDVPDPQAQAKSLPFSSEKKKPPSPSASQLSLDERIRKKMEQSVISSNHGPSTSQIGQNKSSHSGTGLVHQPMDELMEAKQRERRNAVEGLLKIRRPQVNQMAKQDLGASNKAHNMPKLTGIKAVMVSQQKNDVMSSSHHSQVSNFTTRNIDSTTEKHRGDEREASNFNDSTKNLARGYDRNQGDMPGRKRDDSESSEATLLKGGSKMEWGHRNNEGIEERKSPSTVAIDDLSLLNTHDKSNQSDANVLRDSAASTMDTSHRRLSDNHASENNREKFASAMSHDTTSNGATINSRNEFNQSIRSNGQFKSNLETIEETKRREVQLRNLANAAVVTPRSSQPIPAASSRTSSNIQDKCLDEMVMVKRHEVERRPKLVGASTVGRRAHGDFPPTYNAASISASVPLRIGTGTSVSENVHKHLNQILVGECQPEQKLSGRPMQDNSRSPNDLQEMSELVDEFDETESDRFVPKKSMKNRYIQEHRKANQYGCEPSLAAPSQNSRSHTRTDIDASRDKSGHGIDLINGAMNSLTESLENAYSLAQYEISEVESIDHHHVEQYDTLSDDYGTGIYNEGTAEGTQNEPIAFPGAFAIEGVGSHSDDSTDYDSASDNHSYTSDGIDNPTMLVTEQSEYQIEGGGALQAELHEQIIVDGVLTPHDNSHDFILDTKTARRIRSLQVTGVCFCVGVIILVCIAIAGGFSKATPLKQIPKLDGWVQAGVDIFGPVEMPQTLFGSTVQLSGNGTRLAVVAPGTSNETNLNVGSLYIFAQSKGEESVSWDILDTIEGVHPSNDPDLSLTSSNDFGTIAVGFPRLQIGGQVKIFEESLEGGNWQGGQQPSILSSNISDGSTWFGHAIKLSDDGTIIAIGAPLTDASPDLLETGSVHVFKKDASTSGAWSNMGGVILGEKANEYFGWSIDIVQMETGLRLVVGTPIPNDDTGVVRIFDWEIDSWVKQGNDIIGDEVFQRFGESVALSSDGKMLAVGARGSPFDSGFVKIYREVENEWVNNEEQLIGSEPGEGFGASLALSTDGKTMAVGVPQSRAFGDSAGTVRVFHVDETGKEWIEVGGNIGSENLSELGSSVSMSDDASRVAGGAPSSTFDNSIPRVGSVQVYDVIERSSW